MMRPTSTALALAALLGVSGALAQQPAQAPVRKAETSPRAKAGTGTAAKHYWDETGRQRALRVDPAWIADFGSRPAAAPGKERSLLKRSIGGEKALESLPGGVSPVFRDEGGAPLALGGGVIVRLRDADRPDARARLAAAGLMPVRQIDPEGRAWLVESPPGLPSLELANQLHESGRFESATPNWWRPRALK